MSKEISTEPMRKYRLRRRNHNETFAVEAQQLQLAGETFVFLVDGHIKRTYHSEEIASIEEVLFKTVLHSPEQELEQLVIDSVNDGDITGAVKALEELDKLKKK